MGRLKNRTKSTGAYFIYQKRIFYGSVIIFEYFILSMLLTCFLEFHNDFYSIILICFALTIAIFCIIAARCKAYRLFTNIMFIIGNFAMMPFFFIICGGLHGGMPIAFLAGTSSFVILDGQRARIIGAISVIIFNVLLFVFVGIPGKIITPMPEAMVNVDIIITYVLVSIFIILGFFTAMNIYENSIQDKVSTMERHMAIRTELLTMQLENYNDLKRIRHDARHHNAIIAEYARQNDTDGLLRYLEKKNEDDEKYATKIYCMNAIINNIVTVYQRSATRKGVEMTADIDVPAELNISEVDLTTILANLLENAINAAMNKDEGNKEIELKISMMKCKLIIQCRNSYSGEFKIRDDLPATYGTGIESIVEAVRNNHGEIRYSSADEWITANILLDLG